MEVMLDWIDQIAARGNIEPQDADIHYERRRKHRKEVERLQRQANKEYAIAQGTYVPR